MDIIDIYEAMRARGLARSLRHFSKSSWAANRTTPQTPASPGAARARS